MDKDNSKLLASLAVFRELYDSEKDIYSIIASFLNDLIRKEKLNVIGINEITEKLNSEFEFDIPSAVVKTSLKRLDYLQNLGTHFIVTDFSKIRESNIESKQKDSIVHNNEILLSLYDFIERKSYKKLSEEEKGKISHSFFSFLLDIANGDDYNEYIGSFIVENRLNENFKNRLDAIREGLILYSGLKYNVNINEFGSWNKELTIFVETEILFHIAGYNGELYKRIAFDFLNYVSEINRKAGKNLIRLKYFSDVKLEIESFFYKAKFLLEGKETPNPGGTAMITILNGCTSLSDLQNKKTDFFLLLRSYKIEEELFNDYYNPIYHEYNIISNEISEKISSEIGIDVTDYLKVLNYVSIHRKDLNVSIFENIKYVLLTGNSTTFKISLNELIKKENSVPLATTLTFLINKFWFKLTRGLGKSDFPKSFDIITKSQIILSKILNNTLSEKFEEYKSEFKQGKLTEEQAIARIVNLRECVLKPEEINDETVNEVLSIISEDSINKYVEENSYLSIKNKKQEEENRKLEEKLIEKDFIEKDLFETKRELISSKEILFSNLLSNKNVLNEKVEKRFNDYKKKLLFTLIILGIFIFSIVNNFQCELIEKYTNLNSY